MSKKVSNISLYNHITIALLLFFLPLATVHMDAADGNRCLDYIRKAMNFSRVAPQEKVYLHFDNTGYFENETMWFKAYVVRTDDGKPSDMSRVLYVELLNPSGDVVKSRKLFIDEKGHATVVSSIEQKTNYTLLNCYDGCKFDPLTLSLVIKTSNLH